MLIQSYWKTVKMLLLDNITVQIACWTTFLVVPCKCKCWALEFSSISMMFYSLDLITLVRWVYCKIPVFLLCIMIWTDPECKSWFTDISVYRYTLWYSTYSKHVDTIKEIPLLILSVEIFIFDKFVLQYKYVFGITKITKGMKYFKLNNSKNDLIFSVF